MLHHRFCLFFASSLVLMLSGALITLAQMQKQTASRTKAVPSFTAQDSAVMRSTHISVSRARIGQRVIVNASFSPNACNNPASVPLLTCKIENAPEERVPIEERFAYKNRSIGSNNWSYNFRFGYVPAEAKHIIIRALWVRDSDTLTLRIDTAKPTFTILPPNYGTGTSLSQDKQIALIDTASPNAEGNILQRVKITLTRLAPPYSHDIPVQVLMRPGSTFPDIVYATAASIELFGKAPYIDYAASALAVFAGNQPDTSIHWKCTPETLRLRAIRPSEDNTAVQADIEALGIPIPAVQRELYSLQGALVLRYGYRVRNPFNGMIDSMPIRRMWANIRTTFVHDKTQDDADTNAHRSFIKWLRSYVSEATLPEKLLTLKSAKNLNVQILHSQQIGSTLLQRLKQALKKESKELRVSQEEALKDECDIWSKLDWNVRRGLPKPIRMIAESAAPEECSRLWELYASRLAPTDFSACAVFLDEAPPQNPDETLPASSGVILAIVPFGAYSQYAWDNTASQATIRDCIVSALSPNNAAREKCQTYQDLRSLSLFSAKKDDWLNENFRTDNIAKSLKSKTVAEYLDTLIFKERYSTAVQSERASQAAYKAFLAWSDTAKTLSDAPFLLMETDTAAMARIREEYSDSYSMPNRERSERICSTTEEIKRFASTGKPIPPHLTSFGEVEDECSSVAWMYEHIYKEANIRRVLVAFSTSGANKGLPAFAICIGASLLDSNAVTRPLTKQVRKPFMHTLLSAETLHNLSCEAIDGECPVRGSMTTEYRTLYDYCTMKTRQGKFVDRTKEILIGQK